MYLRYLKLKAKVAIRWYTLLGLGYPKKFIVHYYNKLYWIKRARLALKDYKHYRDVDEDPVEAERFYKDYQYWMNEIKTNGRAENE